MGKDNGCGRLAVKCAAEFVGTFILVHVICLSVNSFMIPALPIGIVLAVLVYQLGHVSGAHFNPAVTLAVTIAGGIDWVTMAVYVLVQVAGGCLSGVIASYVASEKNGPFPSIMLEGDKIGLWTEFFFTFLLASTVLNVAVSKTPGYHNNSFFGLAIGFALLVGVAAGGEFSGGAYNPAVVLSVNLGYTLFNGRDNMMMHRRENTLKSADWLLVILIDLVGGLAAGLWFKVTEWAEKDEKKANSGSGSYDPPVLRQAEPLRTEKSAC